MKKLFSLMLVLLFIPLCSLAEEGKYMVLTGIFFDDTLEKVQSYYGKGSLRENGNKKELVYKDQTFGGQDHVDVLLVFEDVYLKKMWFLLFFDEPIGDLFLEKYIDLSGQPIRTDYQSIANRSFEDNAEGDYYLWFEEDAIVYMTVSPSVVHVEYEQYIKE